MIFDQSWLQELMELQRKASELAKNKNSADDIQDMVKTVLNQWGISAFPWEQNFQSTDGFQRDEPVETKNDLHFNIDISEKKQSIIIQINLPGIEDPNDLQIKLAGNTLHISGKISNMNDTDGSFTRKIRLPSEVTPTGASGIYKDEQLTITLPKSPPEGENIPLDFYPNLAKE